MKHYDFETTVNRENTHAIKIDPTVVKDELGLNYYADSISMWVADMDFVCAPEIVDALQKRASLATFGYTAISDPYYDSVCQWYQKRLDMHFSKDQILYSNGTVSAIRNVIRAFTKKGNGVIIQPPVYHPFHSIPKECERKIIENNLIENSTGGYGIDFDDFERKCADPNNKLFIFCNPHNPIGKIWSIDEVQKLMDICELHDVLFFSDEVHADLIRKEASFTSALNLAQKEKLIVATAVNKTFNLAGLHITNLIIPNKALYDKLLNYTGKTLISPFAEAATIAAYTECEEWVENLKDVLDKNIDLLTEYLQTHIPSIKIYRPQGSYLAWLDFRSHKLTEQELLSRISEKCHIILEGGLMFGRHAEGFVRMNIACPQNVLKEALVRLKREFA